MSRFQELSLAYMDGADTAEWRRKASMSTSLHSLSPVALPYMSISGGGRVDNLTWPRQKCRDLLGNLGSDQSCSMDAWETDRLVQVLFLLPPCRSTGVQNHLLQNG